jgi:nucleoside 2-deoxyribosyltransferase
MNDRKTRIYLAGPLFSVAERLFLDRLRNEIVEVFRRQNKEVEVVWPWELATSEEIEALGAGAKWEVFRRCRDALDQCDVAVALLDGPMVDDGTAWEIGRAYTLGKRIIGIRTDFRRAGECDGSVVNCMVECSCETIARSVEELCGILIAYRFDEGCGRP